MPALLRSRLDCFYCGGRSAQRRTSNLRKWTCEKCEAENFLDENGEITDPPPPPESFEARYGQAIPRPESPVYATAENSVFCQTCTKNQTIFTEALAQFYPSPAASGFDKYELQEKEYREGLEDRYPQVCEDCAERVNARLKASRYATNTENLRLFLEESRNERAMGRQGWEWKRTVITIGGYLWAASTVGQLLWNGFGLLTALDEMPGLMNKDLSFATCYQSLRFGFQLSPSCYMVNNARVGVALSFGLVSFWWNRKMQETLGRKYARQTGLFEYYRLHLLSLLVRCLAYYWVVHRSQDADLQMVQGVHLFLLAFTIVSTTISYRTVTVNWKPRVPFSESPPPLRARMQNPTTNQPPPTFTQKIQSITHPKPFSLNNLAPMQPQLRQIQYSYPTQAPTPPDTDSEAMDWTPSTSFNPAPLYHPQPVLPQSQQPSPFHGYLPPNTLSPAHRLRNPPSTQPVFRAASSKKQSVAKSRHTGNPLNLNDLNTFSDPESRKSAQSSPENPLFSGSSPRGARGGFREPAFFPAGDRTDTGLEGLFSGTFSLGEEPFRRVDAKRGERGQKEQGSGMCKLAAAQKYSILGLILLGALYTATTHLDILPLLPNIPIDIALPTALLSANQDHLPTLGGYLLLLFPLLLALGLSTLYLYLYPRTPSPTPALKPDSETSSPAAQKATHPATKTPRARAMRNMHSTPTQGLGSGINGLSLGGSTPRVRAREGGRGGMW